MKVLVLLSIFGLAVALPTPSRQISEPDDCSKECINGVEKYGQELSILKNLDLSKYFNKIDEICEVITTARKCLDECGPSTSNNPFALESLNIVCQPEAQEKIESIKQCLHYIDNNVHEICAKECSADHIIDETDVKEESGNPMYKKANGNCATFKCMARCNIEVVSTQCGKELGKEFQGLLQQVVDTQRKDLENLKLVDIMAKTSPPECNYLYDPSVLFGVKIEESTTPASAPHDPKEDAKSLYAQAQLQLLLKQLELTEKQDQLIDRENAKLDMEMAYMAHKAEQREQRFHTAQQHAIPTYVPMEKMPKEHMPMEDMEQHVAHPEQPMPTEGHPPMEESHPPMEHPPMEEGHPPMEHPPMEEGHAQEQQQQPEEPAHPEQMESHPPMEHPPMPMEAHPPMPMEESHPQSMPSMEPQQQPSMPMEAHPPMDFPPHPEQPPMHGMPIEMIQELPRHPKIKIPSRHPMPIILEGVPMEFVPMDGIPIELPMHMPMEAMPRFL